jgi:hypothetical protein
LFIPESGAVRRAPTSPKPAVSIYKCISILGAEKTLSRKPDLCHTIPDQGIFVDDTARASGIRVSVMNITNVATNVAIVCYDDFTDIDVFLPWEVLNRVPQHMTKAAGGCGSWATSRTTLLLPA